MKELTLLLLVAALSSFSRAADTGTFKEPPFPPILSPLQVNQHRIHIVSESISDSVGYETTEEFIDFDLGKSTFVSKNKHAQTTTHIDAQSGLMFRYAPYYCYALSAQQMEEDGFFGLWKATAPVPAKNGIKLDKTMHLYGLAALWINAADMNKQYSATQKIYSASKDVVRDAHKWTIEDINTKSLIHFFFIETSTSGKSGSANGRLSLESIQVENMNSLKTVRTINILSFDYLIPEEVYDGLLQVPVGYGCVNVDVTAAALVEFASIESIYFGPLLNERHKIELEATATKFERDADGRLLKRSVDTINYELVNTKSKKADELSPPPSGSSKSVRDFNLQLIRQRDSRQDLKLIYNYNFNVQYKIDLRRGTCEMSNLGKKRDKSEHIALQFSNGLRLTMNWDDMRRIFVDTEGFSFIKRTKRGSKSLEYLYFESTTNDLVAAGEELKQVRIIRTYSVAAPPSGAVSGEYADDGGVGRDVQLESVTILVFDENFDNIVSSFHLNVVDAVEINSLLQLTRIFDVSNECYLNNDQMRLGKHFAWFELTYPFPARYSSQLAARTMELKELVLTKYLSEHLNYFLTPRIEFMFEETGFIMRVLMLDIPSLPLLYDADEQTAFTINRPAGDLEELTVDLEHCADLCRLNNCKTMTYCPSEHKCLLSNYLPDADDALKEKTGKETSQPLRKLVRMPQCTSYTRPKDDDARDIDEILQLRLHLMLSLFQHQDYGAIALPKQPDELALPRSETGVDEESYKKIKIAYLAEIYDFLVKEAHRLPMLTFSVEVDGAMLVLMPNKFEIEQDPLGEFSLAQDDLLHSAAGFDDSDDLAGTDTSAPAFHEGLGMYRYKINAFSEEERKKARLFTGLNYDQCSLACIDSGCSSFSYCSHRQECIITSNYELGASLNARVVEQDSDCFIAQRDFLSKFNRFQDVLRPNIYKRSTQTFNPSECAHTCAIENSFRCLAFDWCKAPESSSKPPQVPLGTCFLLEERTLYTGADLPPAASTKPASGKAKPAATSTGCDHYSRSYLADFIRIEYRQIEDLALSRMKTSLLEGRSVDRCAEECVNELVDCSAFQFCFDQDSKGPKQSCTLIESKAEGSSPADSQLVVAEGDNQQDGVVKAGKMFTPNVNCHVFSLRRDSNSAHQRDLALNSMTAQEFAEASAARAASDEGLSIGGAILLYLSLTLISAALVCGFMVAQHQSDFLRQKVERLRILLRV